MQVCNKRKTTSVNEFFFFFHKSIEVCVCYNKSKCMEKHYKRSIILHNDGNRSKEKRKSNQIQFFQQLEV